MRARSDGTNTRSAGAVPALPRACGELPFRRLLLGGGGELQEQLALLGISLGGATWRYSQADSFS